MDNKRLLDILRWASQQPGPFYWSYLADKNILEENEKIYLLSQIVSGFIFQKVRNSTFKEAPTWGGDPLVRTYLEMQEKWRKDAEARINPPQKIEGIREEHQDVAKLIVDGTNLLQFVPETDGRYLYSLHDMWMAEMLCDTQKRMADASEISANAAKAMKQSSDASSDIAKKMNNATEWIKWGTWVSGLSAFASVAFTAITLWFPGCAKKSDAPPVAVQCVHEREQRNIPNASTKNNRNRIAIKKTSYRKNNY